MIRDGFIVILSSLPLDYTQLVELCNFIVRSVMCIIVVVCATIVVIATRCSVSHYRLSEQCRALWVE